MERRMEAAEEREERRAKHARRRVDHAYVCHPPCPAGRCYCPCHQPREEITL
jgi:hypothetical protein